MLGELREKIKRILDSDSKYLIKNSKYKLIFELFSFSIGFLISWIFGNFTSSEFYGTYLFITSVLSFFTFFSFVGINQSLIQSVAGGYDHFFITGIKKIFKYSITGSLALFIFNFINFLFFNSSLEVSISLFIIGVSFPIVSSLTLYHYFLDGKGMFKRNLIYRTINLIITNGLILILIIYTKNFPLHFLLLNSIHTILNIFFTKSCIKLIKTVEIDKEKENEAWKYSIFLTKYGILTLISGNISIFLIGLLYSPSDLAFYVVGIMLPSGLLALIKPSLSVFLTKYSKEKPRISKKFILFLILFSLIVYFSIVLALPIFLQFFFPKYISALNYGLFYSFLFIIQPIVILFGYYFRGQIEKKVIRNSQIISDIIHLVMLMPFLYLFGIYGIIFLEIVRILLRLIIYIIYLKKITFY